jgi:hypothetical protein
MRGSILHKQVAMLVNKLRYELGSVIGAKATCFRYDVGHCCGWAAPIEQTQHNGIYGVEYPLARNIA